MFVKRTEGLTANMPDTVLSPEEQQAGAALSPNTAVAGSKGQPGLAESAGGAAVALAGWAFTSLSSRIGNSDLQTPMLERRPSTPSNQLQPGAPAGPGSSSRIGHLAAPGTTAVHGQQRAASQPNLPALNSTSGHINGHASSSARSSVSFGTAVDDLLDADPMSGAGDWGGDLIDVAADEGDFNDFESAPPAPEIPPEPVVHPRYTITRTAPPTSPKKPANGTGKKVSSLGASRPTGASKAAANALKEIEAAEGLAADWSFDGDGDAPTADDWGQEDTKAQVASLSASTNKAPSASSALAKDKLAQMREERKARLAAAKEKKAGVLGAKKL